MLERLRPLLRPPLPLLLKAVVAVGLPPSLHCHSDYDSDDFRRNYDASVNENCHAEYVVLAVVAVEAAAAKQLAMAVHVNDADDVMRVNGDDANDDDGDFDCCAPVVVTDAKHDDGDAVDDEDGDADWWQLGRLWAL